MKSMREVEKKNPFEGISKEVVDWVFECGSDKPYKSLYPVVNPNDYRLNHILSKIAIVELTKATKLGYHPTIKQILRKAIESILQCLDEWIYFESYTEKDWDRLLNVVELYFFKTILDLDDSEILDDPDIGWLDADVDKLQNVMKELALTKDCQLAAEESWQALMDLLDAGLMYVEGFNEVKEPIFRVTEKGWEEFSNLLKEDHWRGFAKKVLQVLKP